MAATVGQLAVTLSTSPQPFLQPSLPIYTDAVAYLKNALDPLAFDISSAQQYELQNLRNKRKRGDSVPDSAVLRLKKIHASGFGISQIWEQAKRVSEATNAEVAKDVASIESQAHEREVNGRTLEHVIERADEVLDSEDYYSIAESDDDNESDVDTRQEYLDEIDGIDEADEINEDELDVDEDVQGSYEAQEEFVADKFGLNDGFFSIDTFNRRSEFLEQQDMRGEGDGAASDEEEVDWDADPASMSHSLGAADDEGGQSTDDDEDGPLFGDPDASSVDEDEEVDAGDLDEIGVMPNTNNIMYADFFAPPAQKKSSKKKKAANGDSRKAPTNGRQEEDLDRTIAAVHRDLFEDDESEQESDGNEANLDPSDPRSRRSKHERRKAALAEEIRKLEAENVAARQWTLSGEARAADRPLNSLLEEYLDFERTGKPVPVITAEVSESIEELIKRRILAHEFQNIIRRRPDDLATGGDRQRDRQNFTLDDEKSKKGLAEEYEEEHLRRTDPNFVDAKDEKTKKEEAEIEEMWKKICNDLDSLSSWHFRPKRPVAQLDIRVDAPAISMEDARPSAGGEVAGASRLAPHEVYKGGEAAKGVSEEVVGKSGLPARRDELSREEKKRKRRREKERLKKTSEQLGKEPQSKRAKESRDVMASLKQGGVKVIGKKGSMQDLEGRDVRTTQNGVQQGGGQYKL